MIEIKDDFLCFENEKINKTKIYTGKFPTLIGENPFQMKGDCILQMFGLIKPEPFIYSTSLIILVIGILVGTIGSASAVKKYLKV